MEYLATFLNQSLREVYQLIVEKPKLHLNSYSFFAFFDFSFYIFQFLISISNKEKEKKKKPPRKQILLKCFN